MEDNQELTQDLEATQTEETTQAVDGKEPEARRKTKEENFDGLAKKANHLGKETKAQKALIAELEAKIADLSTVKTQGADDKVAALEAKVDALLKQQVEAQKTNILHENLTTANVNPKFIKSGLAKTALEGIAGDLGLDLTDNVDLSTAVEALKNQYPEFIIKKVAPVGTPTGNDGQNNSLAKVLEGKGEAYFNLNEAQRAELRRKLITKQ
jgi:hypothetical protein